MMGAPGCDQRAIAGARAPMPFVDHRFGRRIACEALVQIGAEQARPVAGRIRDVSISGAFIETPLRAPLYVPLEIVVQRDDGRTETRLVGHVVRREETGIAVEWAEALAGPLCPLLGCASRCASARDAGY